MLPCLSLLTRLLETISSPEASQQRACAVGAAGRGSLCPSSPFPSVGELITEIGLLDPTEMKEAALCVTSVHLYMKTWLRPPGAKSISCFYIGIRLGTSSVLVFLSYSGAREAAWGIRHAPLLWQYPSPKSGVVLFLSLPSFPLFTRASSCQPASSRAVLLRPRLVLLAGCFLCSQMPRSWFRSCLAFLPPDFVPLPSRGPWK